MTEAEPTATIPDPSVDDLLALAVEELGGQPREGQSRMAQIVAQCLESGSGSVLTQAGTGTGKSLAYLVPAARHAVNDHEPVVIATATLALQRQLVDKDLPVVARALAPALGRDITYAVLKGRSNYLCLDRLNRGSPDPDESALFDTPTTIPCAQMRKRVARGDCKLVLRVAF